MNYAFPNFNSVSEPKNILNNFSESKMQQIWRNYFDKFIKTNIGNVLVIHPRIQNFSAGPDFQNAIIKLPSSEIIRGAIEIHTKGENQLKHNYHTDPNYQNIILHITLEKENINSQTFLEGYLDLNISFYVSPDSCNFLNIGNSELYEMLYDFSQIRYDIKKQNLKTEIELIDSIFSF